MGESEIDPELRKIPEELTICSTSNNIVGLAMLCFYVHQHRYPSYDELENIMRNVLAKQLQLSPIITEAV